MFRCLGKNGDFRMIESVKKSRWTFQGLLLHGKNLHHLGCIKPRKLWDKLLPISWCRISSTKSMLVLGKVMLQIDGNLRPTHKWNEECWRLNLCYEKTNSFLSNMMTNTWICYHFKRKFSGNRTVRYQGPVYPACWCNSATLAFEIRRFPGVRVSTVYSRSTTPRQ